MYSTGFILLDLLSTIGYTFYFFLVGVQLDLQILKKIRRKTFTIGLLTVLAPVVLTQSRNFLLLIMNIDLEPRVARFLPIQAQAQGVSASPTIAILLTKLKIINSEFGRLAMFSSTVGGIINLIITTSVVLAGQSLCDKNLLLMSIIAGTVNTIFLIFIICTGVLSMLRRNPVGAPMTQSHLSLPCGGFVDGVLQPCQRLAPLLQAYPPRANHTGMATERVCACREA